MKKVEIVNQALYKKASEFCSKKDLEGFKRIFLDNPELSVNENLQGQSWSFLHTAAYFDFYMGIDFLLERGSHVDVVETTGSTPLLFAVTQNYYASTQKLLRYGAEINAANMKGFTPTMSACFNGNTDIFSLLLNKNPNLELKDAEGKKAIDYAKNHNTLRSIIEKVKMESFIKLTEKNTKIHKV